MIAPPSINQVPKSPPLADVLLLELAELVNKFQKNISYFSFLSFRTRRKHYAYNTLYFRFWQAFPPHILKKVCFSPLFHNLMLRILSFCRKSDELRLGKSSELRLQRVNCLRRELNAGRVRELQTVGLRCGRIWKTIPQSRRARKLPLHKRAFLRQELKFCHNPL